MRLQDFTILKFMMSAILVGKVGLPETLGTHAWILIPALGAVFIACFRLFERLERRG